MHHAALKEDLATSANLQRAIAQDQSCLGHDNRKYCNGNPDLYLNSKKERPVLSLADLSFSHQCTLGYTHKTASYSTLDSENQPSIDCRQCPLYQRFYLTLPLAH